ncbi:hypothetical protein DN062_14140 [Nitrincola tibetensis]|jgi:hypothetical protein|uniref:Lacal_2735 family protein n=1 Tax=Nitrincola tibetensis TaxID=2219697 RepID=A0A364NK86_9GAMM|nr:DUF6435 family protein [Nitrincola tibetensis]RAU17295.1 hypothetical protein DN062_14140 [Nitrincola tibetensis]
MFNLFKRSDTGKLKKLQKSYEEKLGQAMLAQRNGDIRGYSELSEQANALFKELEQAKKEA